MWCYHGVRIVGYVQCKVRRALLAVAEVLRAAELKTYCRVI
jgi:hypothetical protein